MFQHCSQSICSVYERKIFTNNDIDSIWTSAHAKLLKTGKFITNLAAKGDASETGPQPRYDDIFYKVSAKNSENGTH